MKKNAIGILSAVGMLLLIIDSKTAIYGAKDGIILCIGTVIPSLFPLLVISGFLCHYLSGVSLPILQPLSRLCGIPKGSEKLLILGFLGGYPVGALNVERAELSGALNKDTAKRMLGFCNNAGPAFIFGMAGSLFKNSSVAWFLWLIHIISAILVGILLPGKTTQSCKLCKTTEVSLLGEIERSAKTMAIICCWIVLFRVVISFCKRWFFWLFPLEFQVLFTGIIELSNGVLGLISMPNQGLRFILSSVMLGLGGICVTMQTVSITGRLGTGYYFPGKLLQGLFSFILSVLVQPMLFSGAEKCNISCLPLGLAIVVITVITLILHKNKNNSRIMVPNLV